MKIINQLFHNLIINNRNSFLIHEIAMIRNININEDLKGVLHITIKKN